MFGREYIISSGSKGLYDIDKRNSSETKEICPQMFYELMIHSDGCVSLCCVDYNLKNYNWGNIMEDTIYNIWRGKQFKEMQQCALNYDNISYGICEGCDYPNCGSTVSITPYRDEIKKWRVIIYG